MSLVIISCSEVPLDDNNELQPVCSHINNVLTIEEALEQLSDFNESFYDCSATKSTNLIADVSVCQIPSTKGDGSDEIFAYVVNYKDNQGFAVIRADKCSVPIVARAENGNLNSEKLNEKIWSILEDCQTRSNSPGDDFPAADESPEDFIYAVIAGSLADATRIVENIQTTYGEWDVVFKYGPLVTVKWNQSYPFNMKMEPHNEWLTKNYNFYRGLPPVGCSNVALGQILATIKQPARAPGSGTTYDWGVLRSLSNYINLSNYLPGQASYSFETNPVHMSKVEDLADFLYTLSELNESTTDSDGTETFLAEVLSTMRSLSSAYFDNAEIVEYGSDPNSLITCVQTSKPVLFAGHREKTTTTKSTGNNDRFAGHTWVVDGYSKRQRSMTVKRSDGSFWMGTQTGYFFHINWGYSGQYDGYYYTGVFDMSQREDSDYLIDTYPSTTNGNRAYDLNLRYIKY